MFRMGVLAFYLSGIFYNLVVITLRHLQEYSHGRELDLGKSKVFKLIGFSLGSWCTWAYLYLKEVWF